MTTTFSEEERVHFVKRNLIRSWRRGTKEMDLILGGFYSQNNEKLSQESSKDFEELLHAEDHEILEWLFRSKSVPQKFADIVDKIREFNKI